MARKNVLTLSKKQKALTLAQANRFEEARALYTQVCGIDRQDTEAWFMLGAINGRLGRHAEAADCCRRVIAIQPNHAKAHYNLGIALRDQGKFPEAIKAFQASLRIQPDNAEAQDCLAHALITAGKLDDAVDAFLTALRFYPRKPELHLNLGSTYQEQGQLQKAVACYREAQRLNPDLPIVYANLGSALCCEGKYDEAIDCYRDGLRRNPRDVRAHSNLLLTLNYLPEPDRQEIFREHRAWGEAHGSSVKRISSYANSRDPERRLRVGYVSQDFRTHSVAYFIEPILKMHDRNVAETYCYADVPHPDATTARLRSLAAHWRDIAGVADQQVANQIRADSIDILVDLAGHTGGNRLQIFAHKPAPVQVTYLGYPNTTGLSTVDYRLTDAMADPDGQEVFYGEQLVRLPGCFLCYQPPETAPPVTPSPVTTTAYITFGSFNNLAKINSNVIAVWSDILRETPGARLLIKNHSLTDVATRERYHNMFAERGVSRERVELLGTVADTSDHLALYGRIDIALDTFPYNGTTTTCEALWMGVPVITLTGRTHAGRVGLSLLTAVGLPELVASEPADYIARATALAADRERLSELRAGIRERLRLSPLCDGRAFTQNLEVAYRAMWRQWCGAQP